MQSLNNSGLVTLNLDAIKACACVVSQKKYSEVVKLPIIQISSVCRLLALPQNDELYEAKKTFLEEAGLPPTKAFPLYNDRFVHR